MNVFSIFIRRQLFLGIGRMLAFQYLFFFFLYRY